MRAGRAAGFAGRAGEAAAERLYRARGAEILARRWRCREGEIDLVLREGTVLVFAEVKARRSLAAAAEAIGAPQTMRLAAAVARYVAAHGNEGAEMRVDVVLVDAVGRAELLENALSFDA